MSKPGSPLFDPIADRPEPPPYCEAYPALSIVGARQAWRDRIRLGEWYNEEQDLVARIELNTMTDTDLDFNFEWVEGGQRRQRREILSTHDRPTRTGRWIPDAMCRGCNRFKPKLYLMKSEWRCAGCHGLVTRASLLTRKEKQLLALRSLWAQVRDRTAPKRGFRTFERKRLRYHMLMDRVTADDVAELREEMRPLVALEWIDTPYDAAEDDALVGVGYRPPPVKTVSVAPWFGDKPREY